MNLTPQQLDKIKDLAYRVIPIQLIANAIEVDELEFVDDVCTPGTASRRAYLTGSMQQMVESREFIIKSARNGSNPAQAELLKFLNENIMILNGK